MRPDLVLYVCFGETIAIQENRTNVSIDIYIVPYTHPLNPLNVLLSPSPSLPLEIIFLFSSAVRHLVFI